MEEGLAGPWGFKGMYLRWEVEAARHVQKGWDTEKGKACVFLRVAHHLSREMRLGD